MNNTMISAQNLTKRYKNADVPAVDNISFSVREGEFFAFLGQNGAGKTTAISILTTTLAKTSGMVTVAGFDIDSEAREVRNRIGIIFQKPSLDLDLSAEENIRLHACIYGMYGYRPFFGWMPKSYRERVAELAGILGIEDKLWKPLKTFSGGMQSKIEIIRSLIHTAENPVPRRADTGARPGIAPQFVGVYQPDPQNKRHDNIPYHALHRRSGRGGQTVHAAAG